MSDTKKGYVPKTFKDSGTGETFVGDKVHTFDAGAYANFKAAGLVKEPVADKADANAAETASPKAKK